MKTLNFSDKTRSLWYGIPIVLGCLLSTGASAQSLPTAASDVPTYLRDIQPIFMGNCSRCHNQESRFIYNWLDYKTAYADRWEIRRRIWDSWKGAYYKEAMPVANSPESLALTDEERQTIVKWVDDGGLRGVPPPPGAAKSKAERIALGR